MHTTEAATTLLSRADTRAGLAELSRAIGFDAPLELAADTIAALGIGDLVREGFIATGPGALRALLVEGRGRLSARESVTAIATRLGRSAPHLLWLLLLRRRGSREVVLATWSADRAAPRVSALVVDVSQVLPSDADTVRALATAAGRNGGGGGNDVLSHTRWMEALGRESLTRRFYRTLERLVGELAAGVEHSAGEEDGGELALLCVSRLLFLSFLQTKGWLDGDPHFLERSFTGCMSEGGGYHRHVLLPLFFGTLNTPAHQRAQAARKLGRIPFLNGGLFARTAAERRCRSVLFEDEPLGTLFGELLVRYRFTAREENEGWSEAAVDPEMLGRVFESLMASRDRRASGAFYTPHGIVASVTRAALVEALSSGAASTSCIERLLEGETPFAGTAGALMQRLRTLTLLDPACGSGAFLVHALETMANLARRLGDSRPIDAIRRDALARSIFGVDVNPTAVWLCELRLWLSVVIESEESDPLAAPPLPNLDHHIRVGDALAGDGFLRERVVVGSSSVGRLRERYVRATGKRKLALGRELARRERAIAMASVQQAIERCAHRRRDLLATLRTRDLFGDRHPPPLHQRTALTREREHARELREQRRALESGSALPFAFPTHFPDIASGGGFDVVVGNPPWVRLHRIPPAARSRLRHRYEVLARPTWESGAAAAHVSPGFAAQTDLAALFVERSLALLREDGALALLLPAKLWRSLAGGGARRLIAERARITRLEDWSEAPAAFDAAVYPSLLVARRYDAPAASTASSIEGSASVLGIPPSVTAQGGGRRRQRTAAATSQSSDGRVTAALHRSGEAIRWEMPSASIGLDSDRASPWVIAPPVVRAAFDRMRRAGPSLAASSLGAPRLGVKCGCNQAFVVTLLATHGRTATVRANGSMFQIERELLRPLVRGEGVAAWRLPERTERIIWTHGEDGRPLAALPPKALAWLSRWRSRLVNRSDVRTGAWWSLFRTAAADATRPRVVWCDFGRHPRAAVLGAGDDTVPLNSCYALFCASSEEALALSVLLNSPLTAAWLRLLAEPARGGYSRYLAWTVGLLPIPEQWSRAVDILAPVGERAERGTIADPAELIRVACRAYRLRASDLAPLLAWSDR